VAHVLSTGQVEEEEEDDDKEEKEG